MGLNYENLKKADQRLSDYIREEQFQQFKEEIETAFLKQLKSPLLQAELVIEKSKVYSKQSPRVLSNWEKEGVIDRPATNERKWRKYSIVEAAWLSIVTELREFGFSLEKIKNIKDSLMIKTHGVSPFEVAVFKCIFLTPVVLVIYSDGKFNLLPEDSFKEQVTSRLTPKPFLYFNLFTFVRELYPNNNFETVSGIEDRLSEKELALLYYLRTGDFEEIRVVMKDGEIYLLEGTRKESVKDKIIDVIKRHAYQDVIVKVQGDKTVHIVSTKKYKIA